MIYGYRLSEGQEFRLSTHSLFRFPRYSQHDPAIYGDIVIWTEGLDNIIYRYSLSMSKESAIAEERLEKCPGNVSYVGSEKPAIYKDIVVWVDCRDGDYDIYGYNLSTEEEFPVTKSPGRQQSPAVYEDTVVWEDERNGNWDIYGCHLSPPFATVSFNYQERRLLLKVFGGLLMIIPLAVAGVLVKYRTKTVTNLDEAPKEILFPEISRRNFMRIGVRSPFDVITVFLYVVYSCMVIFCLLYKMYFLGTMCFGVAAISITERWWNRKIPYIHTTADEIAVFPGTARGPKIVKWDAIEEINQQEGKNTIRLYLPDDKHVKIDLSLLEKNDTEELFKILKQLPCPWTVSIHYFT